MDSHIEPLSVFIKRGSIFSMKVESLAPNFSSGGSDLADSTDSLDASLPSMSIKKEKFALIKRQLTCVPANPPLLDVL